MALESQGTAGGQRRSECRGRAMGGRCTTMLSTPRLVRWPGLVRGAA